MSAIFSLIFWRFDVFSFDVLSTLRSILSKFFSKILDRDFSKSSCFSSNTLNLSLESALLLKKLKKIKMINIKAIRIIIVGSKFIFAVIIFLWLF